MAFNEINSSQKLRVFLIAGLIVISLSTIFSSGVLLLIAGIFTFIIGYFSSENSIKEELA